MSIIGWILLAIPVLLLFFVLWRNGWVNIGWKLLLGIVGVVLVLWFVSLGWRWWSEREKTSISNGTTERTTPRSAPELVEVEELQKECFTPCEAYIAWKFRIRYDDRYPIRIVYRGAGAVEYPAGDATFAPPAGMLSGDTKFKSPGGVPSFRVRVYRLVLIPKTW